MDPASQEWGRISEEGVSGQDSGGSCRYRQQIRRGGRKKRG